MSSKRNLRRRMCTGKRGYPSAERAYAAQRGHALTFNETLAVYVCKFCGRLHLGHPWQTEPRTRRNFKETL
jgi:hypothetical protein